MNAERVSELIVQVSSVIVIGLGVWIVRKGRVARRIDHHSTCGHCGFDLTGRPYTSEQCGQCGARLVAVTDVRPGNRAPRLSIILAGLLTVGLGLFPLTFAGRQFWRRFHIEHYRPVAGLLRDAEGPAGPARDSALSELVRRIEMENLRPSSRQEIAERVLQIQADPNATWTPWEFVIDRCFLNNMFDEAQLKQVAQQAFPLRLIAEPDAFGEDTRLRLAIADSRSPLGLWKPKILEVEEVRIDDDLCPAGVTRPFASLQNSGAYGVRLADLPAPSPGEHVVHVKVRVQWNWDKRSRVWRAEDSIVLEARLVIPAR